MKGNGGKDPIVKNRLNGNKDWMGVKELELFIFVLITISDAQIQNI